MKIILGGAQLGMKYGVSNQNKFSISNAKNIIEKAIAFGFREFDTAPVYGISEQIISKYLNSSKKTNFLVNTKLHLKKKSFYEESQDKLKTDIFKSINNSLKSLNTRKINIIFFHDFEVFFRFNRLIREVVDEIKSNDLASKIGVSVYDPSEANFVIKADFIDVIQIPFNLLDYRWEEQLYLDLLSKNKIELHARSIFLQGLLLSNNIENFKYKNINQSINVEVDSIVRKFNRKNKLDLLLSYVMSNRIIDKIVVGFDNALQISNFMKEVNNPMFKNTELDHLKKIISRYDSNILDPRNW